MPARARAPIVGLSVAAAAYYAQMRANDKTTVLGLSPETLSAFARMRDAIGGYLSVLNFAIQDYWELRPDWRSDHDSAIEEQVHNLQFIWEHEYRKPGVALLFYTEARQVVGVAQSAEFVFIPRDVFIPREGKVDYSIYQRPPLSVYVSTYKAMAAKKISFGLYAQDLDASLLGYKIGKAVEEIPIPTANEPQSWYQFFFVRGKSRFEETIAEVIEKARAVSRDALTASWFLASGLAGIGAYMVWKWTEK